MATSKRSAEALELSADQEALAQAIYGKLRGAMDEAVLDMSRMMASQPDAELLGRGEFALRDRLNQVGAKVLETAVNERSKKGIPR